MFKRVLMAAAVAAAVSTPAFAEVSISGSAEMDLFVRTNQADAQGTTLSEEIAIVVNIDGKDKLDNGATLKWRLAQKVATDYRYDSFGKREAWIGYADSWGELRFGNQFTNAYLTLDWPYGSKAQGNMSADFGALTDRWGDAITYFSPNFGGVNFTAQYKIGSDTKVNNTNTYGYDVGLNGSFGAFTLNAGYQYHNDAAVAVLPVDANGVVDVDIANGPDASTTLYFVGGRAVFGDVAVKALYKRNEWKDLGEKLTADQWLIGGTYSFGKNALSAGYQMLMDPKYNGNKIDSSVQQLSFQWDYSLSKNTGAFLQVRHHMYDSADQAVKFDGSVQGWQPAGANFNDAKSTTRVLVGTWTGF